MALTKIVIETEIVGGEQSVNQLEDIKQQAEGGVKSLTDLKKEFKTLQEQLTGLTPGTQKYIDTLKKLGSVKDEIGDLRDEIGAFAGEGAKFGAVQKAIGGIASGFQAAQGAAVLFGSESEELQKSLLKVQAAMALAEGVKGIAEMGDALKIVKAVAIDAFKGIKAAIGSTGIGAILVILGTIVAYWDDIKAAVSGVNEEQKKLLEKQQASAKATEKQLSDVSKQENILKLMGKSEKDILNIKIEKSKVAITDLEAQLATQEAMKAAQVEAAKRNRDILQGIIKFVAAPITLLLQGIDSIGSAMGKNFGLLEKFSGGLANLVFDPVEVASKADETIQATKDKLQELKNEQAGFQLAIQEIDKQAAAKAKEQAKKKEDDDAAEREYWRKRRLEEQAAEQFFSDELAEQEKNKILAREKAIQDELELNAKQNDEFNYKLYQEQKKRDEDLLLNKKKAKEQEVQLTLQGLQTVQSLADAFAGKSVESQRRAFNVKKAASIAQATIETYQAAQSAYASQMAIPTPDAPVRAAIAAGISIASGLARVAVIAKQKFEAPSTGGGGGGGGNLGSFTQGGGGGAQPPQGLTAQNTVTQINPDGTVAGQGNQQPMKAYVVESESRAVTERVNKLSNNSKIG